MLADEKKLAESAPRGIPSHPWIRQLLIALLSGVSAVFFAEADMLSAKKAENRNRIPKKIRLDAQKYLKDKGIRIADYETKMNEEIDCRTPKDTGIAKMLIYAGVDLKRNGAAYWRRAYHKSRGYIPPAHGRNSGGAYATPRNDTAERTKSSEGLSSVPTEISGAYPEY